MFALATSTVENIVQEIKRGTVTYATMRTIQDQKQQFLKLCAAAVDQIDIEASVDHRIKECNGFNRQKNRLMKLLLDIQQSSLQIDGMYVISMCYSGASKCGHYWDLAKMSSI